MSGSRQPVGIRVSPEAVERVRRELERLGQAAEAATPPKGDPS
jgi:hypothetical protein